jgi:hypothetical protein
VDPGPWAPHLQIGVQIGVCPYRESPRILVEIRVESAQIGVPGASSNRVLEPTPPDRGQIRVVPEGESPRILVEIRVESAQIGVPGASSNRGPGAHPTR